MINDLAQLFAVGRIGKVIVDSTDAANVYYGFSSKSDAGASSSEWFILRVNTAGPIITYSAPVGGPGQKYVWADRGTYTYA